MYTSKLINFLCVTINEYLGISITELELKPEIIIHLVPCWTSETSNFAHLQASKDMTVIYTMSLEQRYPEFSKIPNADKAYAQMRYDIELLALTNFISYYQSYPIPKDTFGNLFEAFINDTSDQGIVHNTGTCMFEDNNVIYVVPNEYIASIVGTGINPHTNNKVSYYVQEQLRSKYRVELSMKY
jgi:hypothetical protein